MEVSTSKGTRPLSPFLLQQMNSVVYHRQPYARFTVFSKPTAYRFGHLLILIRRLSLLLAWGFLLALTAKAAERPPLIDPVSAIRQFRIPPGFKLDLFASEPQLLNPVAFCFDEQSRIYVAE